MAADLANVDLLSKIVNSDWMVEFCESQLSYPQQAKHADLGILERYQEEGRKPERGFYDKELNSAHAKLLKTMNSYVAASATHRVPDPVNPERYVVSVKTSLGFVEAYDQIYARQVRAITTATEDMSKAWADYIKRATLLRF